MYRPAARGPYRSCRNATTRNTSSTSSASSDRPAPDVELGEHFRVHRRVLPHLEFGQVEAERLDLPDQLLEVPVRLSRRARLRQRVLHDPQVGEQVLRVSVAEVGVARAGRGDLAREQQQDAPVRLVRRALGDLGGRVLVGGLEPLPERERVRRSGEWSWHPA